MATPTSKEDEQDVSIQIQGATRPSWPLKDKLAMRVSGLEVPYQFHSHAGEIENPIEPIIIKVKDEPLSAQNCKALSSYLTGRTHRPVYVLPVGQPKTNGFKIGEYCRFTAKIIGMVDDTAVPFEIYRARKHIEQPERGGGLQQYYSIHFGTDPVGKGNPKFEDHLALRVPAYVHSALVDKMKILVFSDKPLEPGLEYSVDGLVFNAQRLNQLGLTMPSRLPLAYCENAVGLEQTLNLRKDVIEKCRDKPEEWFIKSVCYPYDNGVANYLHLITYSTFHPKTGFPFNVMLIGPAAMTKTAFLRKLAAITGDDLIAQSRPKGLLPHFGGAIPEAGALVEARFKALLNEFFENFSMLDPYERSELLSNFKHVLEGAVGIAVSGKGKTRFVMKADLFGATNYPKRMRRGSSDVVPYRNIAELYRDVDRAFLDRILFYPIPTSQREYVDAFRSQVAQIERDCDGDLSKIDYASKGLLTCDEIRNIMYFLRTVRVQVDTESEQRYVNELIEILPEGVFSRHREFLTNVAASIAAIRGLRDGTLNNENRTVYVVAEDLYYARLFLSYVLESYKEQDVAMRTNIVNGLSKVESTLFNRLAQYAGNHDNPYAKAVEWPEWVKWSGSNEEEAKKIADKLQASNLCRYTANKIIFMPDLSPEARAVLECVEDGAQPAVELDFVARGLVNSGLLARDRDGRYCPLFAAAPKGQQSLETNRVDTPRPKQPASTVETRSDLLVKVMRTRQIKPTQSSEDLLWTLEELVERGFSKAEIGDAKMKGIIIEPRAEKYTPSRMTAEQIIKEV